MTMLAYLAVGIALGVISMLAALAAVLDWLWLRSIERKRLPIARLHRGRLAFHGRVRRQSRVIDVRSRS